MNNRTLWASNNNNRSSRHQATTVRQGPITGQQQQLIQRMNNIIYDDPQMICRPSKYLKTIPLNVLYRIISIQINHKLRTSQEKAFIQLRLCIFDALFCYDLHRCMWQSFLDMGSQYQIWPEHVIKMVMASDETSTENDSVVKFILTKIDYFQNKLEQHECELLLQSASFPSTLSLTTVDRELKHFVSSHQTAMSNKINSDVTRFKNYIKEKQFIDTMSSNSVTDAQRDIVNRIKDMRQKQLQIVEELWMLERRVFYGFLPKAYDEVDYKLAPVNSNSIPYVGHTSHDLANQYRTKVKKTKRIMLQNDIQQYESKIADIECQFQQELKKLEEQFLNQNVNGISLVDSLKAYTVHRTQQGLEQITGNMKAFQIRLFRRYRRSSTAKNKIGVSPEPIIDVSEVPLTDAELAYLRRGPGYIRPNQTWLYSDKVRKEFIKGEHDTITEKILYNLSTHHKVGRSSAISKQLCNKVNTCLIDRYKTPLSVKDRLCARNDLKLVKSIRRKLKKANLILRITDKSNVFYIGRSIDFEQKAEAYRTRTNAYIELTYNPLREIFLKVVHELNDLRVKKLIRAWQHKRMLPDRRKTKLAHMYFVPKAHKIGIPLRPITSSIHAPTTGISRLLDLLIRPIFDEKVKSTTFIDGVDLICRLMKYQEEGLLQPSTIFCTFDITDLYTMLPQQESLDILVNFLRHFGFEQVAGIPLDVIRKLAHIVLTENVFVYNKKYYRQILGGAMGSPFTLTLANIFMWNWEKEFANKLNSSREIYGRYIDDVFFTWNGTVQDFKHELKKLNQLHPNIKLVHEMGIKVSFLDVLVHNDNGILSTSVYHKEAAEPYVVPFVSDHPRRIFNNIIDAALVRAVRYSSTLTHFNHERRLIRLKLLYNRYPPKFIDKQFKKFFNKYSSTWSSSQILPIIDNENEFFAIRQQLLVAPRLIRYCRNAETRDCGDLVLCFVIFFHALCGK
ncbi:unnamed protein product [Rotaria sp. Silwood2]|nr:unnamed protein product [Rotaria sp. Silwood2]